MSLGVVKDYVQPATAKSKTNFMDCLVGGQLDKYEPEWCPSGKLSKLPGSPRVVGPTSYFMSHAWSYTFSGLVSLVERHYEGLADTERGKKFVPVYYWVDNLAVTQHFAGDFKDHPDSDFPGVIRASKAVLFTMYPWRSPIAPTRVWCLFEALTAVQSEGRPGCIRDGVGVEAFNAILRKRLKGALVSTDFQAATHTEALVSLVKAGGGRVADDCLDIPRVLPMATTAQVLSVIDSLWPPKAVPPSGSAIPRKLVLAGQCSGQDSGVLMPFWVTKYHTLPGEEALKAKWKKDGKAQAAKERPAKEAAERADRALLWPSLGSCSSLAVLGLYNGWMTADDVEGLGRALRSSRTVRELHLVAVRPEDGYPGGLAGLTRELLAAVLGSRSLEVLVLAPPQVAFLEGLEVPAAAVWDLGGGAAIKDFTLAPVALGPRATKQLAELLAPLPQLQGGAVGALRAKPRAALPGEDYPVSKTFLITLAETPCFPNAWGDGAASLAPVLQVLSRLGGGQSGAGPRSAALSHFIGVATGPAIATELALPTYHEEDDPTLPAQVAAVKQHDAAHQELLKLALQAAPREYTDFLPHLMPRHMYRHA
ncbi:hypothetical protein GPECTOR_11g324 [Gonium pectorale]|uniref:Uncharacterized protein n=1 Tax=Gonium pectorale TaxID=33097 RepID=A0A150GRD2_GONPE|nr:hypothetical protein GPECTOR_11g324 [Gonium pectorale]|eukprot:KXZ51890.1 hypothetical protein GPECTOR_11g324 [Gonium pectorale]